VTLTGVPALRLFIMNKQECNRLISEWLLERYPDRYESRDGQVRPTQQYLAKVRENIAQVREESMQEPQDAVAAEMELEKVR
jgi:hypothetical protein